MIKLAFSPCPNDTFLFHALVSGKISTGFFYESHLGDIQHLNEWALAGIPDIVKVSFFTLGQILEDYTLLPVGSALGFNNGPKIISKKSIAPENINECTVALPGKDTTAYLLYRLLLPRAKKEVFCLYHEVESLIASGEVDAGLIIHETRFTHQDNGLGEVCDLGELWTQQTGFPIPLGGLVAKRDLGQEKIQEINNDLQQSLLWAKRHPKDCYQYILEHSIEKNPKVVQAHIDLYVNSETAGITEEGKRSISYLLEKARSANLLPQSSKDVMFSPLN